MKKILLMDSIWITRFTFLKIILVIDYPSNVLKKFGGKNDTITLYNNPGSVRIPGGCARNKALSASKRDILS
jgi:hypothetical protein